MAQAQGRAIRRALEDRDVNLADISRKLGVARQHVSQVVAGKRESPRVRQAVADVLGYDPWADPNKNRRAI